MIKKPKFALLYLWHDGGIGLSEVDPGLIASTDFTWQIGENGSVIDPSFSTWLEQHKHSRFDIIVDTVDESHLVEDLPKLARRDLNNLIKKRMQQHFRDTEYVTWKLLAPSMLPRRRASDGNPKTHQRPGRQGYFSGLLSDDAIAPWVDAMVAAKSRIRTLTSPSLLAPKLIKRAADAQTGLVLSMHPAGLRQTLVVDGVVRFSRLATVYEATTDSVTKEVTRTFQYLTSSRRISADQLADPSFKIWVVEPGIDEARTFPAQLRLDGGVSVGVMVLPADYFPGPDIEQAPGLVAWASMLELNDSPHYTSPRLQHNDLCGLWRTRLWAGSSAIAACGLVALLTAPLIADAVLPEPKAYAHRKSVSDARSAKLSTQLRSYGVSASEVAAVNDAADQFTARDTDSGALLALIGTAMADERDIVLNRVAWFREPLGSTNGANAGGGGAPAPSMLDAGAPADNETPMSNPAAPTMGPSAIEARTVPIRLSITGSVDRSWSKTQANERVTDFAERFLGICNCTLDRLNLPYDPAPAAALSQSYVSQSNAPLIFDIDITIKSAIERGRAR